MPWELLAPLVFVASFAQAATGIGFGVIAGPLLIHAYGYDRAVVETALFSLAVAAVCSVKSLRWVELRFVALLTAMLPVGLAAGAVLTWAVAQSVIVAAFGLLLCTLGATLLRQEMAGRAPAARDRSTDNEKGFVPAAFVAAIAAFLFAAPGPVAAWGLARADLDGRAIRGTLAVYFIFAYGALVAAFGVLGRLAPVEWRSLAWMTVACVAGTLVGAVYGDRLSARVLRLAIGTIIGLSGVSTLFVLLWRSATSS